MRWTRPTAFREDALLYTLTPHMHFRGKSFRFTANYPDGSEEILLDVPRYDFNWQNVYMLAEPKRMPGGDRDPLEAHFDNSADNLLESRSIEGRPLGRPDVGRDDDRHDVDEPGQSGPATWSAARRKDRRRCREAPRVVPLSTCRRRKG